MIVIPIIVSIVTFSICFLFINALMGGSLAEMWKMQREITAVQRADLNVQMFFGALFALSGFIAIMFFTSRFLIRFVFKKIERLLEMLSDGVHQISDGNLEYRIVYHGDDEFKPICENFNSMATRLKSSIIEIEKNEQTRKELLASISHDLRSPLTSIKAFVEGLLDGVASTPESQKEYLQIIKQKTDDINNMVSQLFLYSTMDMGNYPTNPEKLSIGKEIHDFVIATGEDYKLKGLLIEVGSVPDDRYIFADPLQFRSILTNILDNSAKYKVKENANAKIDCVSKDGVIRIVLEDDGTGVPETALEKLFDVFYRSDISRNNPQQGSGLGLAITSKAIERMGGKIYAENCTDNGLRLIIEIPEAKGEQPK
jgi:signal transduction histidine kinase